MEIKKKYRVDFYDIFDGWISIHFSRTERDFENLKDAKMFRDEKNEELQMSNKKCGEHFGIIDLETKTEILCPIHDKDWTKKK